MTEKEVQEIYSRLLELTKAGTIQWKKTAEEEFTTSFPRSSVAVGKIWVSNAPEAVMWIYNDDGLLVARVSLNELDVGEGVKEFILDPSELLDLVQERVYKYSETTENILSELRKLKAS